MNTTTTPSVPAPYADFLEAHSGLAAGQAAPVRSFRLSRETGAQAREFFGLSADAPVEEIAEKLDALGKTLKNREAGHKLTPVRRGGALAGLNATSMDEDDLAKLAADVRSKDSTEHVLLSGIPRGGDPESAFGGLREVGHALRHVRDVPGGPR